jgi:antitoxin ParD1/3/4
MRRVDGARTGYYLVAMTIMLSQEQEDWLRAQVAAGEFASLDEAVKTAVQRMILDAESDYDNDDDLAWAKPLVDEGLAALEWGEFFTHEEVFARLGRRIAAQR